MSEAIKAEIFKMLDGIEDENLLLLIKEDIACYAADAHSADDLTAEQERELDKAIKEADNGEGRSWEEFKREMEGWKKDNPVH
jgi:hypothetical protein